MILSTITSQKIPKLRFREFQGEYSKIKLGDICYKIGDGLHSTPIYDEMGEYYFVNGNNISNGNIVVNSDTKKVDQSEFDKHKKELSNRSLLLSINGTIGNLAFYNGEKIILGKSACYINLLENTSIDYIYTLLQTNGIMKYFNTAVTGSTIKNLGIISIKNTPINIPKLPEQQKIASFLSSVDTRIEELREKKSLLEEYKKGVMQKIFAREIRFKDENGEEYGEWEEKELGKLLDYEQPTKYLVESEEYDNSYKTPVLTAGKTFILGYTNEANGIFDKGLPVIIFDDFTTATQFVDFPFKAKSSAMKILSSVGDNSIRFLYEVMQQIQYTIGGHGRHWISVFAKINVSVPSIPEQQKIASFLSEIDSKIQSTTEQLEEAEKWKKGLLQGMFV